LDKSKLTKADAGAHALYITVKDEWYDNFRSKSMYVITLLVDYQEKVVTKAVKEKEEEDKKAEVE
jgi:hypothetical protein